MQDQQKVYGEFVVLSISGVLILPQGFTVSLYEYEATIPTLWDTVKGTYLVLS
jgi:hypothetical protein